MKRYIFLLATVLTLAMTGCYDSDYITDEFAQPEGAPYVKTLPAKYDGSTAILRGETNIHNGSFDFEVCQDKEFKGVSFLMGAYYDYLDDEANTYAYLPPDQVFVSGVYYYRLRGFLDGQMYLSDRIELLEFPQTVFTDNPSEVYSTNAILCGHVNSNLDDFSAYFEVSANSDYSDAKICEASRISYEEGSQNFISEVSGLEPGTHYYVRLVVNTFQNITCYGNMVQMNTPEKERIALECYYIEGKTIDWAGNIVPITDDLKVVMFNTTDYIFYDPLIATYNESQKGYEWKEGQDPFYLDEDKNYIAYIFNGKIPEWYAGDRLVTYNGYYEGINQEPIYYAIQTGISTSLNYIKTTLNLTTCQVAVKYPQSWGSNFRVHLQDIYKKNFFAIGSFHFDGDSAYPMGYTPDYYGPAEGTVTSDGNGSYIYRFNIWRTSFPADYVNMIITTDGKETIVSLPETNFNETSSAVIECSGDIELSNVKVKVWQGVEAGDIIVNPN